MNFKVAFRLYISTMGSTFLRDESIAPIYLKPEIMWVARQDGYFPWVWYPSHWQTTPTPPQNHTIESICRASASATNEVVSGLPPWVVPWVCLSENPSFCWLPVHSCVLIDFLEQLLISPNAWLTCPGNLCQSSFARFWPHPSSCL